MSGFLQGFVPKLQVITITLVLASLVKMDQE